MGLLAQFGIGGVAGLSLPGGGSVFIPAPFIAVPLDHRRAADTGALIAYRKYHPTMAGSYECNGVIAVGNAAAFKDLTEFVRNARAALTTGWSSANKSQTKWVASPEKFPETTSVGPNGPERLGQLKVRTVGWLDVYDDPGVFYAVADTRGVMIAIWILNRHGGERRARAMAERIAASFKP